MQNGDWATRATLAISQMPAHPMHPMLIIPIPIPIPILILAVTSGASTLQCGYSCLPLSLPKNARPVAKRKTPKHRSRPARGGAVLGQDWGCPLFCWYSMKMTKQGHARLNKHVTSQVFSKAAVRPLVVIHGKAVWKARWPVKKRQMGQVKSKTQVPVSVCRHRM